MTTKHPTLILGASYGSLLGTKLALAGHDVRLVCLPEEAELINDAGAIVRLPVKGRSRLVEVRSQELPGTLSAAGPGAVDPVDYDLIVLAMQEPQYGSSGVRELLDAVGRSRVPCMSIMNMPPPPYLQRIPGLDVEALAECYTDATVWRSFEPGLMTLASPDPQAFRPPGEPVNVLQVRLPTNFKVARFDADRHSAILKDLQRDIEAARYEVDGESVELPVKLKVHDSIFVPLAKWSMLLAGNYRCLLENGVRSIKDTVHGDPEAARAIYEWVVEVGVALGAERTDLVPFEKYANAALSLESPSSAARALAAGARNIERVDLLVQRIAAAKGLQSEPVDRVVALVDRWLARNRSRA